MGMDEALIGGVDPPLQVAVDEEPVPGIHRFIEVLRAVYSY